MRDEAEALVGEHDFRAFRAARDPRPDTVRTIRRVEVKRSKRDPHCWVFEVEGDRFLYKMVRIIAGTLVDVGRGRLAPGAVRKALETGSRRDLGMTAPPEGLYLDQLELDDLGTDAWPDQFSGD
jgi:tRNA pseudouridine38-40 synthase